MTLTIITVCYNSSQYIRSSIESVLSQSYIDIEYIIIDGASTDGTLAIINEYADRIAHIISEPDKGIYDAMNKGIALATGDVIGILNSDDFYPHSEVISNVVKVFERNPDIDMVLGNVEFVNPDNLQQVVRQYSSFNFSPWKLRFGFMPAHPAAFIKKSAYDLVGKYKLGYIIAADFDMFVRLLLINKLTFTKINDVFVRMRIGGVSTSGIRSNFIASSEMLRALRSNSIYSNSLFISIRLLVKFVTLVLVRLKIK